MGVGHHLLGDRAGEPASGRLGDRDVHRTGDQIRAAGKPGELGQQKCGVLLEAMWPKRQLAGLDAFA